MGIRLLLPSLAAVALAAHGGAFLEDRPGWEKLNAKAVELARRNMEDLGSGWKPQMTCMPGFGVIWQWDSCYMALYAGLTPKGVDGLGHERYEQQLPHLTPEQSVDFDLHCFM